MNLRDLTISEGIKPVGCLIRNRKPKITTSITHYWRFRGWTTANLFHKHATNYRRIGNFQPRAA